MTANDMVQLLRSRARPPDSIEERPRAEAVRFGALSGAREEPYLLWFAGFVSVVLVVVAFVVVANSHGWLQLGSSTPAVAVEQLTEFPQLADRFNCAEIGGSNLRSPPEELLFQTNCVAAPEAPLVATNSSCNRRSLDAAEFGSVGSGLYVFHQAPASHAYLWYSSSETCFDLVSTRVVTAVCADQSVSFSWNPGACSTHGGVLAWVNGR